MGKSSKRYFSSSSSSHHYRRSRSKSPDTNRYDRSSSHVKSSSHSSSSTRSLSSSFDTNKHASEKLKKTIKDQIRESKGKTTTTNKVFIPIEEQIKMMNKIDEINYDPFKPKQFISNRSENSKTCQSSSSLNLNINLSDIPLPRDMNSWRENPRILLAPKLLEGTKESRQQKWQDNLLYYGKKLLLEKRKNEINTCT
ncbi:LOW QUALITY PROTEIN: uncharacterized protein LOC124498329 [Dermatophagoides farinae]|uniref:LOW QUALITY PROTEIN: uncharacterized protein LOC124498329 n=1 Tax=Dermatophagoides farinae TaxID=6954 RepID=UPI003F5E0F38